MKPIKFFFWWLVVVLHKTASVRVISAANKRLARNFTLIYKYYNNSITIAATIKRFQQNVYQDLVTFFF